MSFELVPTDTFGSRTLAQADWSERFLLKLNFGWRTRADLYEMMALRLGDGSSHTTPSRLILQYIGRLKRRTFISGILARGTIDVLERVYSEMEDHSRSFADAMAPLIPADEYGTLVAGERARNLGEMLTLAVERREMADRIVRAARKPALVIALYIAMLLATVIVMAATALQDIVALVRSMGARPTFSLRLVTSVTDMASGSAPYWATGIVFVSIIAVVISLRHLTGAWRVRLEMIPPWSTYRNIQGFLWLTTFVMLVRSGEYDTNVLRDQMQYASPWLKERLEALREKMLHHAVLLPEALEEIGFQFPSPELIDDISNVWGVTQNAYDYLLVQSRKWSAEIERKAIRLADRVMVIGTLAMWICAGLLYLASQSMIPVDAFGG
ncbi:integral membrane protein PilR [Gluconacetobacter sacchari DSM 12717]|uniref:Pilus biosynthesis protein PilR n=2 Tax=Gluconacetobacter sacchari TaxID=92759 RepID=A0A7W4IF14_9PROT|nr:pilus biosynthesis protein PilR [Gluconacetobacter sacchari]MBB2161587.1 pilus biosynthesis protein PilR [Gluconacetobacter sacchari]GBQ21502.1 integral membrane protein PilR [Gluconacetobacter sacchari DSM 12717]